LRDVWQRGTRILLKHYCEPSLEEKAISVHEAMKEKMTTVAEEAGFHHSAKVECKLEDVLSYYKEILQANM
jgi:hypothetical protein